MKISLSLDLPLMALDGKMWPPQADDGLQMLSLMECIVYSH